MKVPSRLVHAAFIVGFGLLPIWAALTVASLARDHFWFFAVPLLMIAVPFCVATLAIVAVTYAAGRLVNRRSAVSADAEGQARANRKKRYWMAATFLTGCLIVGAQGLAIWRGLTVRLPAELGVKPRTPEIDRLARAKAEANYARWQAALNFLRTAPEAKSALLPDATWEEASELQPRTGEPWRYLFTLGYRGESAPVARYYGVIEQLGAADSTEFRVICMRKVESEAFVGLYAWCPQADGPSSP